MIETLFLPLLVQVATTQAAPPETPPEKQEARAPEPLSFQEKAALRCSAALALVGARQTDGEEPSNWPDVSERGREFFVQSLAGIMDTRGLDRAAIEREVRREAQRLIEADEVDAVMPACLLMLEAAGL
ncbi:MAG: hypothetical protein AAFQ90_02210 [Pseudomonadota bacterium]